MKFKKGYKPWNKGEKLEKPCEQCGKTMLLHPCRFEIARFCNSKCYGEWKTGSKVSQETKMKMSEAGKKRVYPPMSIEHRNKLSIAHGGKGKRLRKTIEELQAKKTFRNKRYETRKRGAVGTHSFMEWQALKSFYKYMCLCCKRTEPEIKLSQDHIVPLSKGGSDYITNIQPLCTNCNTRKFVKEIDYRVTFTGRAGEINSF